jgi:hypothetical protein
MISKKLFVSSIGKLHEQYLLDQHNNNILSEVFGEGVSNYNNTALYVIVLDLLKESFPADKEGFCEIEHYCFEKDFGKVGDEYESPEELYDRLSQDKIDKTLSEMKEAFGSNHKFFGVDALDKPIKWDKVTPKTFDDSMHLLVSLFNKVPQVESAGLSTWIHPWFQPSPEEVEKCFNDMAERVFLRTKSNISDFPESNQTTT